MKARVASGFSKARERSAGLTEPKPHPGLRKSPAALPLTKSVPANARTDMTIRLAKILVAVDFSKESKKALRYAAAFGSCFAASLTVLHFVEPIACQADYGYGPVTQHLPDLQSLQKARKRLNVLGKRLAALGVSFNVLVRSGVAHHEIARAARELDSDLVIMGTCGALTQAGSARASTAESVVRHAPCPVLIVRKKEHEFVSGERGAL